MKVTQESRYWDALASAIANGDRKVAMQVLSMARRDLRVLAGHESVLLAAQDLMDAATHRRSKLYRVGRALARATLWIGAHLRTEAKTTAPAVEPTLTTLAVVEAIDVRKDVTPSQDGVEVDACWLAFISGLESLPAFVEPAVSAETALLGELLEEQVAETALLGELLEEQVAETAAANWRRAMGQPEVQVMHLEWTPIKHRA